MATANESTPRQSLDVSRTFNAPPELVFKAWSAAEHLSRWFSPHGFTIPECEVEFRPGGKFELRMKSDDGTYDQWLRGHYVEIVPHSRLVLDVAVITLEGKPLFSALTTVGIQPVAGGTEMTVNQRYTALDPSMGDFTRGAEEGWAQTLDRLGKELERMGAA
ncbi:SRPBCC domain-containing protein [Cupriavidus sp. DL-D2]|uniref:SRPBCC family protein n=1 Tax=Cupriavidus sp. DL-D2 TaxID=3144974 RepID=UPI003213B20D